jgi:glycosyltransferase involved in cell wall biosynthesis
MSPKVSVIMSVYNGEKYLREAVDSILTQTFTDFEFIIINDGSRDRTKKILESYVDPRIRLYHHQNIGLTRSLNRAISLARGDYIARMDADDISCPERLDKQVGYLDENPEVGLVGSRYIRIDKSGLETAEIQVPIGTENILKHFLLEGSAFCHSSMIFRKSVAEKIGFYDESVKYAQDYDFGIKCFEICEVANYPEILQKWRYNDQSGISVTKNDEQKRYSDEIRKKFIENTIDKGMIGYEYLKKLCLSNPNNKLISSAFFREYEKLNKYDEEKSRDGNDYLIYLKLKYLHENPKWEYLNKIGSIYLNKSKLSLSLMCFTESLRLNPIRREVLEVVQYLKGKELEKKHIKLEGNECKVSVVMPTYNRGEDIKESIGSVLDQTFKDFELLVINDGGSDEVNKIVDSYDSVKIKYFKLDKNRGLSAALNEGILRAKGEYIAYLDDDDIYYPNHLERLTTFIEENNHHDAVYSDAWWCYGERKDNKFVEISRKLYHLRPKEFDRNALFQNNYISTLNILHKKSCFNVIGLFNEDLIQLMDWEMWMRFSKNFNFHQLNDITGEYRWHNENMTIKNHLEMAFLFPIIKFYYNLDCGNISLAKSYIEQGDIAKAQQIFGGLLNDYDHLPESSLFTRELYFLSRYFGKRGGMVRISRGYFRFESRNYIREVLATGKIYKLFYIIDLLLLKILKSTKNRCLTIIRERFKRNVNSILKV